MTVKKLFAALLACLLALTSIAGLAEVPGIEAGISGIQKYGNIVLDISGTEPVADMFAAMKERAAAYYGPATEVVTQIAEEYGW